MSGMAVNDGTAPKDVTGIAVRIAGGALKSVTQALIRLDRNTIRPFFTVIGIALSSYSVIGRGNSAGTATVTSAAVTANVTGAIGTISYVWTRTAPDAHAWTINSPNAQTTTFTTTAAQNESWTATFICTATDSAGQVIASTAVTVNNANIYYGGGYQGGGGFGGGPLYQ
jgi:hypothetical protein